MREQLIVRRANLPHAFILALSQDKLEFLVRKLNLLSEISHC